LSTVGVVYTVLVITTGYGTKDLELQKYIKLCGIIQVPHHYTRVVAMTTLFFYCIIIFVPDFKLILYSKLRSYERGFLCTRVKYVSK
ncbi:MAG: hypothetical protein E6663_09620, partial [Staphylococcus lugdunensis]|nr:hypothetical protein [Staphylococcus lugdunensis]